MPARQTKKESEEITPDTVTSDVVHPAAAEVSRQGAEVSSGKWLDTKTGQVVDEKPEEGKQLVSPGTVETAATRLVVERAEAAAPQTETATDDEETEKATDEGGEG